MRLSWLALPDTRLPEECAAHCHHAIMTAAVITTFIGRQWAGSDALLNLSMVQAGNMSGPVVCSQVSLPSALPASGSVSGRGSSRQGSMHPRLPPGDTRSCSRYLQSPRHAGPLQLHCQSCCLHPPKRCISCSVACSVTPGRPWDLEPNHMLIGRVEMLAALQADCLSQAQAGKGLGHGDHVLLDSLTHGNLVQLLQASPGQPVCVSLTQGAMMHS